MSLHQALVMSCDTVFYQIAYQMWLRDNPSANLKASPKAPVQQMQKMELALGLRPEHRDRPAGGVAGHRPDPAVALQLLGAVQELLVQARPAVRQLHPADRVRQLPERVRSGRPARR